MCHKDLWVLLLLFIDLKTMAIYEVLGFLWGFSFLHAFHSQIEGSDNHLDQECRHNTSLLFREMASGSCCLHF